MRYKTVIWDWNGTLIDDVDIAIECVNRLLTQHALPPTTYTQYLKDMEMPIIKYYEKVIDVDKVPFDEIASQFQRDYAYLIQTAALSSGAEETVRALHAMGAVQIIISSFEQHSLLEYIGKFGLLPYFDIVSGAQDNKSEKKTDRACELTSGMEKARMVVIGDTVYDYEMAQAIGCDCFLLTTGHQGRETLAQTGAVLIDDLRQVVPLIQ